MMIIQLKNFKHFSNLSILYNYLDNPIKLFSDWYLAKFLDNQQNRFFRKTILSVHDSNKT